VYAGNFGALTNSPMHQDILVNHILKDDDIKYHTIIQKIFGETYDMRKTIYNVSSRVYY